MEGSKGSFIPKSPVGNVTKKRPVKKLYVVSFIVYAFFVGSLVVAGGTFAYQFSQEQRYSGKLIELDAISREFDSGVLQSIVALDTKIRNAATLLAEYNSVPTLLTAIERFTVSSVQLSEFSYRKDNGNEFVVAMVATNPDFNVALFQRQQLENDPLFAEADVTNVMYSAATNNTPAAVRFTITNALTPGSLPYQPTLTPTAIPTVPVVDAVSETESDTVSVLVEEGEVVVGGGEAADVLPAENEPLSDDTVVSP